jgi:D-alanine-D-alanine ligase-like ATP-grasp enzyme
MKILITGVGGPTPRSFAISLKKYSVYKRFELVGTDVNPLSMGLYQDHLFNKTFVIPPAKHTTEYWAAIERIIEQEKIDMAVILPELEVIEWSKRKAEGKLLPCMALIPDLSIAELLVDKSRMTDILDELGLVPPSVSFQRDSVNTQKIAEVLPYPFWIRSSSGTSGLGSLKVESEDALRNWIYINPSVTDFLASKYLPGRNLACKLLYNNGKLVRAATGERVNYIMAKVAPSGITGNTSFGRLLNEPKLVEVAKKAMEHLFAVSKAAKHGFFTVDFKEDEKGTPYITEINVRHVAFTQCFAAGGANFAEDTVRILDNDPTFSNEFKQYEFEAGLIFLRDVDSLPIIMKEDQLFSR